MGEGFHLGSGTNGDWWLTLGYGSVTSVAD
jgi:hypothetical protein